MTNDNNVSTTNNNNDKTPLIPSSQLMCKTINNHESRRLFKVLFDSGGSHTFIHSRCLPLGANATILQTGPQQMQTIAGNLTTNRHVFLKSATSEPLIRLFAVAFILYQTYKTSY